jgi:hypothetical protein
MNTKEDDEKFNKHAIRIIKQILEIIGLEFDSSYGSPRQTRTYGFYNPDDFAYIYDVRYFIESHLTYVRIGIYYDRKIRIIIDNNITRVNIEHESHSIEDILPIIYMYAPRTNVKSANKID